MPSEWQRRPFLKIKIESTWAGLFEKRFAGIMALELNYSKHIS